LTEKSQNIAQLPLDFSTTGSMCGVRRGAAMNAQTIEIAIKAYLTEIRSRLETAASIAKATEACALSGHAEKGIEVALDVEQIVYEVNTFLNAASLINRLGSLPVVGFLAPPAPSGLRGPSVVAARDVVATDRGVPDMGKTKPAQKSKPAANARQARTPRWLPIWALLRREILQNNRPRPSQRPN
jgi:hypothetical protein